VASGELDPYQAADELLGALNSQPELADPGEPAARRAMAR